MYGLIDSSTHNPRGITRVVYNQTNVLVHVFRVTQIVVKMRNQRKLWLSIVCIDSSIYSIT